MIKKIMDIKDYLKDSFAKGWFAQYRISGDVISPKDRHSIKKATAAENVKRIIKMLDD